MRTFAILLLLLNLGYLGWQLGLREREPAAATATGPAPDAPRSLRLLSEAALPPAPAERCLGVGVFAGAAESEAFAAEAEARGYSAEPRQVEVAAEPDYWVHIPPFASAAAAQRRLQELRARDIDSYLIGGGELEQGISLGVFGRRESALRLQEQILAQGYESSIYEIPRSSSEYWVEVGGIPGDAAGREAWAAFMAGREGLQEAENLCETIAPQA